MDVILHLGAHKTASTYIQRRLENSDAALRRHGIAFYGPKDLRPVVKSRMSSVSTRLRRARWSARRALIEEIVDDCHALSVERLVISEEQFLGSIRPMFEGEEFYGEVEANLSSVIEALHGVRLTVMFCVRSYEDYYTSAFGQVLRSGHYMRFNATLRDRLLSHRRGWVDVVGNILSACPTGTPLHLWRYEQFRTIEDRVMAIMLGESVVPELGSASATLVPGPSEDAIAQLEIMAGKGIRLDGPGIRRVMRSFGKQFGFPRYRPWTQPEEHYLNQRYLADIGHLRDTRALSLVEISRARTLPPQAQSGVSM